ncbi:MAG: hypothetical protein LBD04_11175 [Synergistaceae bacterium]|jgi:hypothetical protein|nr:hypothetical protein [Synergistaceae bacterium]
MKRSITEDLTEALKKKKADFIGLKNLPKPLQRRLGVTAGMSAKQIEDVLSPHLGDSLTIKKGGKAYLAFRQPDEDLLFHLVQKYAGSVPRLDRIPFKKDELLSILNRLIEQGTVRVKITTDSKGYRPFLIPTEGDVSLQQRKSASVSKEKFKETYFELEHGNFYVRICDLRRRLGWTVQEFDAMLIQLRDDEKIQLQAGDIDFFSEEDIRESFIDENGFRRLTLMWR